jgi:phage terminase small subunit
MKGEFLTMKKENKHLTWKQQRFVEAYAGDGVKAAKEARYKGDRNTLAVRASQLLRMPKIKEAIEVRNTEATRKRIADREELQEGWTKIFRDENVPLRDRMRAGELLAKSQAMFTDKMLVAGRFQHDHLDRVSDEELMDKIAHSAAVLAEMGIVIPLLPESTEVDQKVPESEG